MKVLDTLTVLIVNMLVCWTPNVTNRQISSGIIVIIPENESMSNYSYRNVYSIASNSVCVCVSQ